MKNLIDILNESKTSDKDIRNYIKSWLRQDRQNYDSTIAVILEAMMDYFKEELDYYEDKDKVASGKQSKENNEAANLYHKVVEIYNKWDNIS